MFRGLAQEQLTKAQYTICTQWGKFWTQHKISEDKTGTYTDL